MKLSDYDLLNRQEYYEKMWNKLDPLYKDFCIVFKRYMETGIVPQYSLFCFNHVRKYNVGFHSGMIPDFPVKNVIGKRRSEYEEYDQEEYALKIKNLADKAIKDAQESISEEE
jgi:hypothetical protein